MCNWLPSMSQTAIHTNDCHAQNRLLCSQQTAMHATDYLVSNCHAYNSVTHKTDCLAIWHTDMTCIQQTAMDINKQSCVWLTGTYTADNCICNILPYTWHTTVPDTQQTAQHVACCHACDRLLWVWQTVWHKTDLSRIQHLAMDKTDCYAHNRLFLHMTTCHIHDKLLHTWKNGRCTWTSVPMCVWSQAEGRALWMPRNKSTGQVFGLSPKIII